MITTAAHEINQGRPPHLEPGPEQERDFFFIERPVPERALETVVEVVAERAAESFGVDPIREVQTLAPMYRGPVGIDALNERLQARLNPDGKQAVGERFRIGDRLIQTRNSHELGLMNGSIVFLRCDDPDEEQIVVDTDEGGDPGDALLGDGDAEARLRDLGPQGAGLRGAGGGRGLSPLPHPDADPTAALHRDHPGAARLRPGRRLGGAGAGGRPRRGRRAPLGPGRPARHGLGTSACRASPCDRLAPRTRRSASRPARPRRRSRSQPHVPWLEIGLTLLGFALLAGLVARVPALRHAAVAAAHGETGEVREQIKSLGAAGPLIIIGLAVIHSVVPYPAEIVNAAAGFAYGFFGGLGIVVVGWMISALDLLLVRCRGRAATARPLVRRRALRPLRTHGQRGGVTLLIALRLLPIVPFSLISAAAGAAGVPFGRYCWTTAVGFLPITALAVYLGTRLEGIRFTDPAVIGALVGVVVLLVRRQLIIRRSGATDEPTRRVGFSAAPRRSRARSS